MATLLFIFALLFSFSYKNDVTPNIKRANSILSLPEYQDIQESNINKIELFKVTIAGLSEPTIYTDKEDISRIYSDFENTILLNETTMSCEDNSTIYEIYLKDGSKKTINYECGILVTKDKRYRIDFYE